MKHILYFILFSLNLNFAYASSNVTPNCPRIYFELNTCVNCLEKKPIKEFLVIGNSLTFHGRLDSIGWLNNWGLAASAESNDWVHLLQYYISQDQGKEAKLNILSNVDLPWIDREWDRITDAIKKQNNEIIFIEIGDNALDTYFKNYEKPYRKLLNFIKKNSTAPVIMLSTWRFSTTHGVAADTKIEKLAKEYGYSYINISHLFKNKKNQAANDSICQKPSTNRHVCWHPGDQGMRAIAYEVCHQNHASIYNPQTEELTLEDILADKIHYAAKLRKVGNYNFSLIDLKRLKTQSYDSHSSDYNKSTSILNIKRIFYSGEYYDISLKYDYKKILVPTFNFNTIKKSDK